nr:PREDICTED: tripartite motif-containing protein 47-like [Lepisosteus oculatus]
MAETSISLAQEQLSCSICLDILKNPVTIPCGHSYCMGCIKSCWDLDDQTGIYSCPQCRQTFSPRPVLRRNMVMNVVVEEMKKTGLSPPHLQPRPCSGPGDVPCDFCTGRQMRAVKSCLVCLASYCQTHLQPHCESDRLRKHKLVDATAHLDDLVCPSHDKPLEVYCRTDQRCICVLCTKDEHRGHDTVSAAAERTEKQEQLGATQTQTQQRLQEREKELQELRQAVKSLRSSAHTAVQDTDRIFTELIRSIERTRSEVLGCGDTVVGLLSMTHPDFSYLIRAARCWSSPTSLGCEINIFCDLSLLTTFLYNKRERQILTSILALLLIG